MPWLSLTSALLALAATTHPSLALDRDGASLAGATTVETAARTSDAEAEPCTPVPVYRDGATHESVCAEQAAARGLTVLDLSADFAPHLFDADPSLGALGIPPYRAAYVALADERWDALPDEVDRERYLELFGIFPTFRVLAERVADDARHACHAAIDDAALEAFEGTVRTWSSDVASQREQVRSVAFLRHVLEAERVALDLPTLEALEGHTSRPEALARYLRTRPRVAAIEAVQDHLVCDGLLVPRYVERGVFDARTAAALAIAQRRQVVVASGVLDLATRRALAEDSHESDFRAVLRALRERVVDATHAIEDGSARGEWGTVFGRSLDPDEMRSSVGHPPLPNGAADWISPATEAAAAALGWTRPERVTASALRALPSTVAVALPPRPAYDAPHMDLRAEVDRGDVYYDPPSGPQPIEQRPTLTLFVRTDAGEVALARWPTTIGGWKRERSRGGTRLVYKESPWGPRIWRDVIAAPAWLPPPSSPDAELVHRQPGGRFVANRDLFGPGYRSAYGLAMVMHTRVVEREGEAPLELDEGVRVHGSVSYGSILHGTSHGCHRLYNHLAVRLAGFLLAHRRHVRHGSMAVTYARRVRTPTGSVAFRVESRGYRYELTPPVEVNVLEGRIRGHLRAPVRPHRGGAPALGASEDE